MQSKLKANSVITHEVDNSGLHPKIVFHVRNAGTITLDMDNVSNEVKQRAAIHGMIQRISDAAAISRDPETGQPASPQDKLAAMTRLVEHYMTGSAEWSTRREGGGSESGLLFQSLSRLYPEKSAEEIRKFLDGKTRAEKNALLNAPKVREIADSIRAESGRGVDAEKLLAGL